MAELLSNHIPKTGESSGAIEGEVGGRACLFRKGGCGGCRLVASRGSSSHGETLSGRRIAEGSSHWTCQQ